MRVVVALGGSALLPGDAAPTAATQDARCRAVAERLAPLAREHEVVLTHGNGPHAGLLARAFDRSLEGWPLGSANTASHGLIGHDLVRALTTAGPEARPVAVLCRAVVDRDDPAFARPTKPIGPDDGRTVPSPEPVEVPEADAIATLVRAGHLVVCLGGGGAPVARGPEGTWERCDAVVDKDRTSAWLAQRLDADVLVFLMDRDAVYRHPGTDREERVERFDPTLDDLEAFDEGEMQPKLASAAAFASTGGRAMIGALEDLEALLAGRAGTRVQAGS